MPSVTLPCQFCTTLNRVDTTKLHQGPKCAECGRPFLLDRPIKVAEEAFDATVLKSDIPVLVDFYADWCGPCRMMAPYLDEIAREQQGRLLVVKVDTDRSPDISARYNIRSIPFFGRFEHGEMVKTAIGAVGKAGLNDLAAQQLDA
jgi:thioredoxin 2